MELTFDEAVEMTDKLWLELAKTGDKDKKEALEKIGVHEYLNNFCPCCEYALNIANSRNELKKYDGDEDFFLTDHCKTYCPKMWPAGVCQNPVDEDDIDGYLFEVWCNSKQGAEKRNAAKNIVDLPSRKKQDFDI